MSQATSVRSGPTAGSPFVAHEQEFARVLGPAPRLEKVADVDAHEGPVYFPDEDALYFTTLPRPEPPDAAGHPSVSVKRLSLGDGRVSVVRRDANAANGMAADLEGRLVVCEQGTLARPAAITRLDRVTGQVEAVLHSFGEAQLNSPNDVAVRSDGTLWFTDPSYGFLQGFRPEPQVGDHVYRHDARAGTTTIVADSFDKPNGLAFSPDERTLYVADSGANHEPGSYDPDRPHHIRAFDVDGGRLARDRLFAEITPGFPDGLKVDSEGRVFASSFSGVQVFEPGGGLIGEILVPGAVNFTFAGPDRDVLLITADDAIWAAHLGTTGAPPRPKGA